MTTPRRVLIMTAHPDDADIMAGGTVARWIDEGHEVYSVMFTRPSVRVGDFRVLSPIDLGIASPANFNAPEPKDRPMGESVDLSDAAVVKSAGGETRVRKGLFADIITQAPGDLQYGQG
jgi:hypothetical protein